MYITLTAFKTVVYKMTSDCVINLTSVLIQSCVSVVVEGKPVSQLSVSGVERQQQEAQGVSEAG